MQQQLLRQYCHGQCAFLTCTYIELSTAYMPHASLVAFAFLKLFCWGVTDCSSRSVHFWQDGSANWSPAGHGHTPLRFHFATLRSSTVAVMLSTVTSFCFPSSCTITGVSSVSRGCSDVILAGCTTREGAGASALAWAVRISKAFSVVGNQQRCKRDSSPGSSCVGISRPCALETSGTLRCLLE